MRTIILGILFILTASSQVIFDFNTDSDLRNWRIVNDGVMGGLSQGTFSVNEDGHGVFEGEISLKNNGGFSSVRHYFQYMSLPEESGISIRLKGDGKPYEFSVKHDRNAYYSYVYSFPTSGEWEEVIIPLNEMSPSFRGRSLNMPDFDHSTIGELSIQYGNGRPEPFRLMIDEITLVTPSR